jgi:hypothetical protein
MSEFLIIGLIFVFIASGWIQQKTVDKWTQDTGRAPMIHKHRGSWDAYMKVAKHEMPAPMLKRISLLNWIGYLALILILLVAAINPVWH